MNAPLTTPATTTTEGPALGKAAPRRLVRLAAFRDLALVPPIIILLLLGAAINDRFLTGANVVNILSTAAPLAILVLAASLVLLTGKFDLSLESTVGLAPAIGVMLVAPETAKPFGLGWPTWMGFAAVFVIGAVIGLVNGLMVVKLKLNAFIVTLAMLIILRGLQIGLTGGATLFGFPTAFNALYYPGPLDLPWSSWIAVAAFVIAGVLLRYHRVVRSLYAIGGNEDAARAAGIRVERVTIGVYVVASAMAAFAGLCVTAQLGAVASSQGDGMIFTVFAAAVIGGVSLDGGRGTAFGAACGVLLITIVGNLLVFLEVPVEWNKAITGGIILLALMVARITSGKSQA
jgi:simple sugar transport system permease protein